MVEHMFVFRKEGTVVVCVPLLSVGDVGYAVGFALAIVLQAVLAVVALLVITSPVSLVVWRRRRKRRASAAFAAYAPLPPPIAAKERCRQCGGELPSTAVFCPSCGFQRSVGTVS
jgi:hypothetical protein